MKKMNYLSIFGLLAVISFSSCKDEPIVVSSAVTVATKDSATISGYVTAELNLQSAGFEAVPAGTSLLVSLPYSDLNSSATGNWQKTITVGADGKYSVKVPTNTKGVTVKITALDFDFDQIQAYVPGAIIPNLKLTYSIASNTNNVVSGQSINNDIVYANTAGVAIGTPKVNISGKAQADLDASIIGLENLPDGIKIIFTAAGWADSTSVTGGRYSISVPKGSIVSWSINKIISTKVWKANSLNPSQSVYELQDKKYSINGSNGFAANNLGFNITTSGNGSTISEPFLTNTVSGTAKAELDGTLAGLENLADGTLIYFYTSTWGATATVSNGSYTINVPIDSAINYYIQFVSNQKNGSGVITSHTFQANSFFNVGTVKTAIQNITAITIN